MGDLNTTPRTWAAGEVVTAAMLNAQVRDPLTKIQDTWTDYTCTWSGAATGSAGGRIWPMGRSSAITA